MTSFVMNASIAVAISCAIFLILRMVLTSRVPPPSFEKIAAVALLLSIAVFQVYLQTPDFGKRLAYFLLPVAAAAVLHAFICTVKNSVSVPPSEGPDVKIPAVAKLVPHEMETLDERQEHERVA